MHMYKQMKKARFVSKSDYWVTSSDAADRLLCRRPKVWRPAVKAAMKGWCPCAALPKRFFMLPLLILGILVVVWQSIAFTMYCYKWQDYYGYQKKQPFVYAHLVGLSLSLLFGSLATVQFGANRLFGLSLLVLSLILEVAPLTIHFGIHGLAAIRFLCGVAEGFLTPSLYGVLADWTPVSERTTVLAIVLCSTLVGGRCMFQAVEFEFVTSTIMFANVLFAIAWFVAWRVWYYRGPHQHPTMTKEEKCYITANNGRNFTKHQMRYIPWRYIVSSFPFWIVCFAVASAVAEMRLGKYNYFMYLGEVRSFPSLPLVLAIGAVIVTVGVASDFLKDRALVSTGALRKVTCTGALLVHAGSAMLLGLSHSVWISYLSAVALGVFVLGIECNHLDLAPQHVPVLKAISSTLLWLVVGGLHTFVLAEDVDLMSHHVAHVILPVCQMAAAMLYFLYGEGERQDWDLPIVPLDKGATTPKDIEAASASQSQRSSPLTRRSQEPTM